MHETELRGLGLTSHLAPLGVTAWLAFKKEQTCEEPRQHERKQTIGNGNKPKCIPDNKVTRYRLLSDCT